MAFTLRQYRQHLARALDDLETYQVTSSTADATVVAALVNETTGASDRRYDGRWAYVSAGTAMGEPAVIKGGGYAPATGVLSVADPWGTVPGAGDTLELTGLFPAVSGVLGADTDYRALVNRALSYLLVPDHLDLTTVAGQQEYPLAAYARWLDRPSRATGLLDPPRATGYPRMPSWRRWDLKLDGGTPTLALFDRAYPTSGATLQLLAMRPGDTLVNGAESSVGLVLDTDTAVPDIEDATTVGLMLACEALANRSTGRPNGDWHTRFLEYREMAHRLVTFDRTREIVAEAPAGNASRAVLPPSPEAA